MRATVQKFFSTSSAVILIQQRVDDIFLVRLTMPSQDGQIKDDDQYLRQFVINIMIGLQHVEIVAKMKYNQGVNQPKLSISCERQSNDSGCILNDQFDILKGFRTVSEQFKKSYYPKLAKNAVLKGFYQKSIFAPVRPALDTFFMKVHMKTNVLKSKTVGNGWKSGLEGPKTIVFHIVEK